MNTQPNKRVEEIVEEFWGKFAWCDLQNSNDNKRMDDWLRTTLTTVIEETVASYQTEYEQKHIASAVEIARKEEREKIVEWAKRKETVAPCHIVIRDLITHLTT